MLAFPCRAVHASQWMRWSERNKTVGCCSQGDGTTSPGERERQSLSGCRGPFRFLWFRFPATALRRCWLCGCRAKKCSHRDPIPELRRTVPHRTVLSTPMDVMPRGMEWNNTIEQNRTEQNAVRCCSQEIERVLSDRRVPLGLSRFACFVLSSLFGPAKRMHTPRPHCSRVAVRIVFSRVRVPPGRGLLFVSVRLGGEEGKEGAATARRGKNRRRQTRRGWDGMRHSSRQATRSKPIQDPPQHNTTRVQKDTISIDRVCFQTF